ncbi:hypothetical protein Bca52824_094688 [Brassica carinata]|uniref:Uncharacterized protein n=1 Tax=Brassica carinata TaxID=52824 RepID=A0A8X7P3J8_BRACI|nr:hypothetical protein Bca52824_094688 [Brassica carinata]
MEESTAANADTLRLELKKTMTEILDDGGVSKDRGETDGALVAVDEAVRILNRLREVESKMPDSDTSSSSPASLLEVPKEFKCMLAYDHERTCRHCFWPGLIFPLYFL